MASTYSYEHFTTHLVIVELVYVLKVQSLFWILDNINSAKCFLSRELTYDSQKVTTFPSFISLLSSRIKCLSSHNTHALSHL